MKLSKNLAVCDRVSVAGAPQAVSRTPSAPAIASVYPVGRSPSLLRVWEAGTEPAGRNVHNRVPYPGRGQDSGPIPRDCPQAGHFFTGFHWISYVKSTHWNLIKMCHIPIGFSDRDVALEAGGRRAAGNGRRHCLGIPSGSFALTPELLRGRDAACRSKCVCRVTTNRMRAGYPAHSS